MTQAYLYLRFRSTGSSKLAAFKEVNMQTFQIGEEFGNELPSVSTNQSIKENLITQWQDDIYAVGLSGIWKFDPLTNGPWALAHEFADRNTGTEHETHRMGLTPCSIDGSGVLVTAYPATGGNLNFRVVKIDRDGNITEGPTRTLVQHGGFNSTLHGFENALSYRNAVVFTSQDPATVVEYDLGTDTFNEAETSVNDGWAGLCVFRDKIFLLGSNATSHSLFKKDGSTLTSVASSGNTGAGGGAAVSKRCLFPVSDNSLIGFTFSQTDTAYGNVDKPYVIKFDFAPGDVTTSATIEDLSQLVLGDIWTNWSNGNDRSPRWHVRQDILTNGPDDPLYTITLTSLNTPGEGESQFLYSYAPPSGTLIPIDGGLNAFGYSSVNIVQGIGGQCIWPGSGTLGISAPELTLAGSQVFAKFRLTGPNISGVILQPLYDKQGEYSLSEATISATTVGSLSGNLAIGLPATPGGTEVILTWEAAIDGITITDNPNFGARVYTP